MYEKSELVATHSSGHVDRADILCQERGEARENVIAGSVAVAIVDRPEAVQINVGNDADMTISMGPAQAGGER